MGHAAETQDLARPCPRRTPADIALTRAGPALTAPYARGEEIYAEEAPAVFLYRVVSGAVRLTRILSDGRRQVGAFLLPGDCFGLEPGAAHGCSAEAVVDTRVALVRRATIEARAAEDAALASAMWRLTQNELARLQDHMLLLGRKSAVQRVSAFLLEMAARAAHDACIDLPMSRSDIADYLGLTIETVSRTLSQLERDGYIRMLSTRTIVLRAPRALAHIEA
ncbi:MAG: helix-turn-helix domain-containing protein [Alphaproteobacteria bacterium]|nr:helix-turn-helix domain-containing protein [Alphaproteobacteria bacterium]